MKIFRLLPLSIHNSSLYKFRFESHARFNSYRARLKVVLGTNCTRFEFSNKDWSYTNNNDNIKTVINQLISASIMIVITSNTNRNNSNDNKINSNNDNIETTTLWTI